MERDREVVSCQANGLRSREKYTWSGKGYGDWLKPYERYVMAQFKFSKPEDIEEERQKAIQ